MFSGMQRNCTSSGLGRPSIFDSRSLPALVPLTSWSESFPNRKPGSLHGRNASDANPKGFHQPLGTKRDVFNHVLETPKQVESLWYSAEMKASDFGSMIRIRQLI
jgi:hypothetical protein